MSAMLLPACELTVKYFGLYLFTVAPHCILSTSPAFQAPAHRTPWHHCTSRIRAWTELFLPGLITKLKPTPARLQHPPRFSPEEMDGRKTIISSRKIFGTPNTPRRRCWHSISPNITQAQVNSDRVPLFRKGRGKGQETQKNKILHPALLLRFPYHQKTATAVG